MKKFATGAAICLLTSGAYADKYIGVAFSNVETELSVLTFEGDSTPSAINLTFGSALTENVALEGLLSLGASDDDVSSGNIDTGVDFGVEGIFGGSIVGMLPLGDKFKVYGKLGLVRVEYEDSDGDTAHATGGMYGVGAALDFTEKFGINLEYIEYPDAEYDDFDIDVEASSVQIGAYIKI